MSTDQLHERICTPYGVQQGEPGGSQRPKGLRMGAGITPAQVWQPAGHGQQHHSRPQQQAVRSPRGGQGPLAEPVDRGQQGQQGGSLQRPGQVGGTYQGAPAAARHRPYAGSVDGPQRTRSVGSRVNARAIPGQQVEPRSVIPFTNRCSEARLARWHQSASRAGATTPPQRRAPPQRCPSSGSRLTVVCLQTHLQGHLQTT